MQITTKIDNLKNHQNYLLIKKHIHQFMAQEGITQVELPTLSPCLIPESYLDIFRTTNTHFDSKPEMYLTPSPEIFLKRLLVEGMESCYYLGNSYRNNEPISIKHNHEFTMLEFYKNNTTYKEIGELTLKLFNYLAKKIFNNTTIIYKNKKIDLTKYEYITVEESFKKYTGITNIFDHQEFFKQAQEKGYRTENLSYVDLWSLIYGTDIEPFLGTNNCPTIIYDYPPELAAMVNIDQKTNLAQRLEIYIEGIELGNCGNESTNDTNLKAFKNRLKVDSNVNYQQDTDFINIISKLKPCSGIAIGVDRLALILLSLNSIQDLQLINLKI